MSKPCPVCAMEDMPKLPKCPLCGKRWQKYGAKRVKLDGFLFDSKKEANRYGELKLLELRGEICNLEVHPRFPLVVNGVLVCTYVADFRYVNLKPRLPRLTVEDTKGVRTQLYKLKKKLMLALHRIEIVEV